MALFSNEDVLSWFCSTNPIARPPEDIKFPPDPGLAKAAELERLKAQQAKEEAEKQKQRKPKPQPIRAKPPQKSYFDRLREASRVFDDLEPEYDDQSRPFDREVTPESDDWAPQTDEIDDVYKKYWFNTNLTPHLPIADHRANIVRTIERNSVTVIQGETGCGKSTQVPQYILDHHAHTQRYCNIVCTQPRRIAATSIARYVCDCRDWELGTLVGYQIGMDRVVSDDTRLTFVTTGVLLQKMVNMKNLNQYTHVILDEVHERDKDTDFCLLVVKKLLKTTSRNVKVILMSATIEAPLFANYFSPRLERGGYGPPAPLVLVKGRTFHVLDFFLDDIRHIPEVSKCLPMDVENPRISEEIMRVACRLIVSFYDIEFREAASRRGDFVWGTVLVFLPGMPEIREMEAMLKDFQNKNEWRILPLHSTMSSEEQRNVFQKPDNRHRKIILATNIAESSITVPDIKYVIDFCLVKQLTCDWSTKYVCLKTVLASQASLTQRKGRAGRVSNGRCYRLITRAFYTRHIPEYSTPEMLRCPLESIVLKTKKLDFGEPCSLLGSALQAPKLDDIERAILNLKEVGALTLRYRGVVDPYNGDLTGVGEVLETLPIDVRLGKLIILGHVFGCLEECVIIAAALSAKPMLVNSYNEQLDAYKSKRGWAEHSESDCIAYLNAFWEWHCHGRRFLGNPRVEAQWCKRNKISVRAMREVGEVVRELTLRLAKLRIRIPGPVVTREFRADPHNELILKLVMCGAFYPQFFRSEHRDEEDCQKNMSGHDPKTTVMLSSLPAHPERYSDQICQLFKNCGTGKALHFEPFKVFVEFKTPHPSRTKPVQAASPVLDAVYIALKRSHERGRLSIWVDEDSDVRGVGGASVPALKAADLTTDEVPKTLRGLIPPTGEYVQVAISEYIDAGHFWAQLADKESVQGFLKLQQSIVNHEHRALTVSPKMMENMLCLAPFSADGYYYRARIIRVRVDLKREQTYATVVFVDYGNVEEVNTDHLCELHPRDMALEMQAFECFLTHIKPSIKLSSDGKWCPLANTRFRQLTFEKYLCAGVFSVVDGKARVELIDTNEDEDVFINKILVDEGFAEDCDEPYDSKLARVQAGAQAANMAATKGPKGAQAEYKSTVIRVDWITEGSKKRTGLYGRRHRITGPDSSYLVSFRHMTIMGGSKDVLVERDSVNCFVVCGNGRDPHERLMVASHVSLSQTSDRCQVRNTTLLPNIHGLAHIATILFAPRVEMRADKLKQRYVGAICGLGFDEDTDESVYSEHDIELTFDTQFTDDDLKLINDLRMIINLAAGIDDIGEIQPSMLKKLQQDSRNMLKKLILESRESVTPSETICQGWDKLAPEDILQAGVADRKLDTSSCLLYPLHNGIQLRKTV